MKRYDRYEDGIVIDNQKGENNLFELIREGDMVEVAETCQTYRPVEYLKVHDTDLRRIREAVNEGMIKVFAIWFRSGNTMTRYELKGEKNESNNTSTSKN